MTEVPALQKVHQMKSSISHDFPFPDLLQGRCIVSIVRQKD